MNREFWNKSIKYRKIRKQRKWLAMSTLVLSLLVVALVTMLMSSNASAMSVKCGYAAHAHGEDCYALTCSLEEHVHGTGCFDEDGFLICEKMEHAHGEDCYILTCGINEHVHDATCYEEEVAYEVFGDTDAASVSLTYGLEADARQFNSVEISEIKEDSREYNSLLKKAEETAGSKTVYARFFDISPSRDGREAGEIEGTADVTLLLKDSMQLDPSVEVQLVHFKDEKAELVDCTVEENKELAVSFETDSFSVFGILYTVDFAYEVNGRAFGCQIPGGGAVSLGEIAGRFQMAEDIDAFLGDVAEVVSSNPAYVYVQRIDRDMTVGEIKNEYGLQSTYAANADRDSLDSQVILANDYAIISLQPFASDETLTVKMKDGESFVIKMTDDQDDNPGGQTEGESLSLANLPNPTFKKTVEPNNDGTYTLSLCTEVPLVVSNSANKANIVVIFDSSNSMHEPVGDDVTWTVDENGGYGYKDGRYGQLAKIVLPTRTICRFEDETLAYTGDCYTPSWTRMNEAKLCVKALGEKLLANNTSSSPDTVEIAFVEFASTIQQTQAEATTDLATFESWVDNCHSIAELTGNFADNLGGTNWDAALRTANDIQFNDDDPVYIVFVTDGNPTARTVEMGDDGTRIGAGGLVGQDNFIDGVYGTGNSDDMGYNLKAAQDAVELIEQAGKNLYNIGIFGDATKMQQLGYGQYFDAMDRSGMETVFDGIVANIAARMGYTEVVMADGLTSMTSSTLVPGKPDGFMYQVLDKDGNDVTETMLEKLGYPEATYEETEEVKEDGTTYIAKEIKWDLGNDDLLLEGGKYILSFIIWPSQEAYDLVSDLNNGKRDFSDLNDVEKEQVEYADGTYRLKTNTHEGATGKAVLEERGSDGQYTVTEEKPQDFIEEKAVNPMPLDDTTVTIQKVWNDSLDPQQLNDIAEEGHVVKLKLAYQEDGVEKDYITGIEIAPPSEDPLPRIWPETVDGQAKEHHIPSGLMVSHENAEKSGLLEDVKDNPTATYNGKLYYILEEGHDCYFKEESEDYHFELEKKVYHPMVVDGEQMTVTYKSDGTIESIESLQELRAVNNLKGGINLCKLVVDDNGDVVDSDDEETEFRILGSIVKDGMGTSLEYRIYGEEYTDEKGNPGRTEKQMIADSANIALDFHAGDYIRFINVPTGYTYSFHEEMSEVAAESYEFYSIEGHNIAVDENGSETEADSSMIEVSDGVLTGTSVPNVAQNITIKNKRKSSLSSFSFKKAWLANGSSLQDIGEENLLAWPQAQAISVDITRTAANEKDESFILSYVLDEGEGPFYPVNEGMSEADKEKHALSKTVDGKIATFALGSVLEGKPYVYHAEEKELPGYVIYYGNLEEGKVSYNETAENAKNKEVIINLSSSGYELPESGGRGTLPYYVAGMATLLLAGRGCLKKAR